MESDDEQHLPCSFFDDWGYSSKSDITQAVIEFNRRCNRPFRVVKSDGRRYKAECTQDKYLFVIQFAFSHTFGPPTRFPPHSCQVSVFTKKSQRCATAKQIATNSAIREMAMTFGRKLTPVMIRVKLRNEGMLASYMNCVNALDRLKVEFFGSDNEQYGLLPSYVAELQN